MTAPSWDVERMGRCFSRRLTQFGWVIFRTARYGDLDVDSPYGHYLEWPEQPGLRNVVPADFAPVEQLA